MNSPILHSDDFEIARNATSLANWWKQKHQELREAFGTDAYDGESKILIKKFYEEIGPLSKFMEFCYSDNDQVTCTPQTGNQKFDAILQITEGKTNLIEVTFAKDGERVNAQSEMIREKHHCFSSYLPIVDRSKKPKVKPPTEFELRPFYDLEREIRFQIQEKSQKKIEKDYPKNTILVVAFDDSSFLGPDQAIEQYRSFLLAIKHSISHNFEDIFLVGENGFISC